MLYRSLGLDRSKYTCTRITVDAEDGKAKIPVTLLHRKTMQLNGRNPTLMRSYGAYGVPTDIDFRVEHFPLLERGWIIALAHVRGGSELGTLWYHQGKLMQKRNTFTDFINVAEHLVEAGYTNPRRLTATGVSAGGLLMGIFFFDEHEMPYGMDLVNVRCFTRKLTSPFLICCLRRGV